MAINIQFDTLHNPELPTLILAKRDGTKLGKIEATGVTLADYQNDASEISFNVNKYINGELSNLWDEIINFRLIWCENWDLWFEITVETDEADSTTKTVSCAQLGQAELSQIMLYDIEINTETDIERDDYEIPTVLYNPSNPEASLLDRIMEKAPHYSIAHVDDTIANIQRSFSFSDTSIYDAFQEIAEEIGCLFVFNSDSNSKGKPNRTISVYDLESNCISCGYRGDFTGKCPECESTNINEGYGNDTTIFVSADGLGDEIQFTTDTDSVKNCFKLVGGDDLMTATIKNCNPNGSDYIWYITDDTKKDMSDELKEKIESYDELYQYYKKEYVANISSDLLDEYNALVKKYQEYNSDLETLDDKLVGYSSLMTAYYNTIDLELYLESTLMPDASLSDTSAEEQAALLTTDNISPVAVTDVSNISLATANSAVLAMAKVVVDSKYQVKVNDSSLSSQTWTGSFIITNYSDEDDTATSSTISIEITDDYEEYLLQMIEKELDDDNTDDLSIIGLFSKDYDDFCSDLKKYCLDSLTSFYDACQSCLDILIEQGVGDAETWSGSDPNLYDDLYAPYYEKLQAIESEMALRQDEIDLIAGTYDTDGNILTYGMQTYIEGERSSIQSILDFENYIGEELWLEFCAFRREDKYQNDNYISDGLDNAELFNNALEFIEVAEKEIYKSAELQHSISATLKNLLVIEKFEPLLDYFEVGNWIRVSVDDEIYKLRLIGYEIDYDNLETISVDFSDVMKTADGISDKESILSQAASMASSYSATQRQASQGSTSSKTVSNWRSNGLDVTNTKIISGADNQSQSWDSHGMLFRKYDPLTDTYEPTQSKIINSTYAITDDAWKTIKTAIGNFYYVDPKTGELVSAYGINGEVLIGNLILGESLGIYTSDGSMTFDEDGLVIDTSSGTAFTIKNGDNVQFYIDADGNVVLDNGATITWGNIDLTDLILSSGNIVVYDEDGQTVYDEDGNPIDIFTYTANYINTKYLTAEYITSNCIDTQYLNAEEIDAYLANIVNLSTSSLYAAVADIVTLNVQDLTAEYITAEYANLTYATIANLDAAIGNFNTLLADYALITELEANYIKAKDISSVNIETETFTTTLANIVSLLAGDAGVGDLQAINLSSSNVIIADATITSAMIASLAADKITSGTIYTSLVTIQTAEDDASLYISGSTLQINDGNYVRVQIGEDGNGDYNLYLWDASGNLLWDALGLTEAGVSGNGGIIKDIAVADDAAIKGTKLDIESVASCLTEDGSLVVDASKVTINDSTLAAEYKTITQSIADIKSDAVSNATTYYALGASADEPPCDPATDGVFVSPEVGSAIVGSTTIGVTVWTTERLTASEENYLWVVYYIEYVDGTEGWTTPTCITDDYIRSTTSTLVTSFEVLNGQITSKVWQSDIEEATNSLGEKITTLTDKYSEIVQTQEDITATVAELVTSSDSHESRISSLEITADGITTTVSEAITKALDGYATQEWATSEISQSADNITQTVEETLTDYAKTETVSSMISQSADDILLSVGNTYGTSIKSQTAYFALGSSSENPPSDPTTEDSTIAGVVGAAVVGNSMVGTIGWSTTQPDFTEDSFTWVSYLLTSIDGTTSWTTPVCITDDYVRTTVTDMGATLEVTAGAITSKVWMDDIEEVNENVTILLTQYSEVIQNAEDIVLRVVEIEDTVASHTETIAELQVTADSITSTVSNLEDYIDATVQSITYYYAASANSEYAPDEGTLLSGIVGTAIVEEAQVGNDTTTETTWSTEIATLTDAQCYLWMYTVTVYSNGITEQSEPELIGSYGSDVTSVYQEYYLSTSDEELSGGEWSTECPEQTNDGYLWTRMAVEYSDGTITYSSFSCLTVWNSVTTIIQTIDSITSSALEEYVTTSEFSTSITTLESTIEQTSESITFTFESRTETLEDTASGLQKQLDLYATYFIFASDGLRIAEEDSEFSLLLSNDRISFLDDGAEVAYITDSTLYITDAYLVNSLRIGSFQWVPRDSGNLSLVKASS